MMDVKGGKSMPLPTNEKRVKRSFIREEVYAKIKDWIICGELQPGEKIRDQEVADSLGVSRTPVREALRRLEDEGFVQTHANRWTQISPLDVSEIQRIYPIVAALERLAVSTAPDWSTEQIRELTKANNRLEHALLAEDAMLASEADHDFHNILVQHSSNPELTKIVSDLKLKLQRHEIIYFNGCLAAEESIHEHAELIRALQDHDHSAAAEALQKNWHNSLKRSVAFLNRTEGKG
jgi:DNA-binding GntR family transcriptional regulator